MANVEDVIELGSSDEETEPAPKRKKPMPGPAMVCIPNKLPGVTIKPANRPKTTPTQKPKINPISIANTGIGKGLTVTKITSGNKVSNPFAKNIKLNGKPIVRKQFVQTSHPISNISPALSIRPTMKKVRQVPVKVAQGIVTAPTILRPLPPGIIPPGITVKRTSQLQTALKPAMKIKLANVHTIKTAPAAKKSKINEMVCVNLDDDEVTPSHGGPQWYLRPEEQVQKHNKSTELEDKPVEAGTTEVEKETTGVKEDTDLEKQNEKEPDTANFIEITIEDSPAKPLPKGKRTCEVSEMAITIDDSPVKGVADKPSNASDSDEEHTTSTEKHSKKKLEYPKNDKRPDTVEIEIELTPVEDCCDPVQDSVEPEIVEIEESPIKPAENFHTSTPKKRHIPKPQLKMNNAKTDQIPKPQSSVATPSTPGEFHPVYQNFINLCFQLENTEDMKKIAEKKIKGYYRQVPKEYTESEVFLDMVASKINAMKADPVKMYLFIKDVVDELNLQRKIAKSQPAKLDTVNEEQEKFLYGEESEFDSKRQRQIRKLEKTLKKLHRAIQKLEEQEVDFDDEEDSVYLLTESEQDTSKDIDQPFKKTELLKRYKERMIRVHAKFCQLTNTKMPSEPRVQIDARPGQQKGPAKRLEKWINKKVPIGTPLPFPDFHDVLRCVREANQEDKLGWNEADIMEEARDLFTRCGRKLQRRRQENEWRLAASRIQSELDPAEESDDLKKKLEDNRRVASKKETEVFNKYADRQNQLKLEGVEIGDKEADESPVETDEEEPTEESTSLENKEKRKERLKRLLQEKSKREPEGKKQSNETEKKDNDNEEVKATSEDKQENSKDDNSQMETEVVEKDHTIDKQNHTEFQKDKQASDSEKIQSLSDDSNKIDSDIDELHLLQKLHSDVVDTSTLESSDSESPIAISDELSSGDNKKQASDVISIENSSYSESEKNNEQEYELVSYSEKRIVTESVDVQMEIECSEAGVEKKIIKSNNDEYNESVEDILLASSDDEANGDSENLKDDPIPVSKPSVEKQPIKENAKDISKKTSDISDSSAKEKKEMNADANNVVDAEVTSITSTETGDDELVTNVAEVTSVNSVETVEDESNSNSNDNDVEVTSIKSVETLEDEIVTSPIIEIRSKTDETEKTKTSDADNTSKVSTESFEDKTMTSLVEENADKVNSDKSKECEITSGPDNELKTNSDESKDANVIGSDEKSTEIVENEVTHDPMEVDDIDNT